MKIVVCVKVVTVLDEFRIDPDRNEVIADKAERVVNEWDLAALEHALVIREQHEDASVSVITVGGDEVDLGLRRCLAMGADRAIQIEAESTDLYETARQLAHAIGEESPDLVLSGAQSSDAGHAATGTVVAELIGYAHVAVVRQIELSSPLDRVIVHRELEGGRVEALECALPAVLTIQTGGVTPRYASLRAIRQAEAAAIEKHAGMPSGARAYRVRALNVRDEPSSATVLTGGAREIATEILDIVRRELA